MQPFRFLMAGSLLVLLAGCATMAPGSKTEKVIERDGVSTLLIPPEYRDVYFNPDGTKDRHCRAPGPDFSVEASDGVSLGVGVPVPGVGKGQVGFGSGQAALSLGGRSADVLITRELLYRACEMTANIDANKQETIQIYERFLQAIERIAKVQTETGTQAASDEVTSPAPSGTDAGASGAGSGGDANGGDGAGDLSGPSDGGPDDGSGDVPADDGSADGGASDDPGGDTPDPGGGMPASP